MEAKAFREIYDAHARKVYNYVLWLVRSRHVCDDVVQSVFIKVWKRDDLPEPAGEQEAWLFAVARNACMDFFRSNRRSAEIRTEYAQEHPSHCFSSAESSFIWEVLKHLSAEEKSIVYLHVKMGYNYSEIGRSLGMKENAVRVRAFRAFKRLRDMYTKEQV